MTREMSGVKVGTVESVQYTSGSLGQQYTKIDGVIYWTWFDLNELLVRRGALVTYRIYEDEMTVNDQKIRALCAVILTAENNLRDL